MRQTDVTELHATAAAVSAAQTLHGEAATGLCLLEAAAADVQEDGHSDDMTTENEEGDASDTNGSQGEHCAAGSELTAEASEQIERERDRRAVAYEFASEMEQGDGELAYLHSKVSELETQLQELKHQQDGDAGASESILTHRSANYVRLLPPTASVSRHGGGVRIEWSSESGWEDIAARQLAERHKAEMENVRLKLMLEGQIKVAKGLQLLIEMRANAQVRQLADG